MASNKEQTTVPTVTPKAEPASSTRAAKSRNGFTRGASGHMVDPSKVAKYAEVISANRLTIPAVVAERFKAKDLHLGWVRYFDKRLNDTDIGNLHKRLTKLGYTLVDPADVPEISHGYREVDGGIYGTMVVEGDLALVSCPLDDYLAQREVKAQRVLQASQGILKDPNSKHIHTDTRGSFVYKGRRPSDPEGLESE